MNSHQPTWRVHGKPKYSSTRALSGYNAKSVGTKSDKPTAKTAALKPTSGKKRSLPASTEYSATTKYASRSGLDDEVPLKKKLKGAETEEKRLRRFRKRPPQSYIERLERVRTQRMFLIERDRKAGSGEETFDIAGTTGNIYRVTISKVPSCSCPDAMKGNHCKHIIYVMVNVLKAPSNLAYQVALLSTELKQIFAAAPVTKKVNSNLESTDTGGTRKPIEGDCPVCVMAFEDGEELVWCKAACGQNIHKTCFAQWQRSKPGQIPKCVFCRSNWKEEAKDVRKIVKERAVNSEGYVNVAGELGISTRRDMSTYHPYWVSGQSYGDGGGRGRYVRNYDYET